MLNFFPISFLCYNGGGDVFLGKEEKVMNIYRAFLDRYEERKKAISYGHFFYSTVVFEGGHSRLYYEALLKEAKLTDEEEEIVDRAITISIDEIKKALKRDREKLNSKTNYMNRWSMFYIVLLPLCFVAFADLFIFFLSRSEFEVSGFAYFLVDIFIFFAAMVFCLTKRNFFRKIAERDFMLMYDDFKDREKVLAEHQLIHEVLRDKDKGAENNEEEDIDGEEDDDLK
jgi:hypothetical protein